ncbi:MAG: IPT/TIG domain-containing protein [Gemmatimonadaceae bacterium]|nr:IPT/TIG domain-containing protein [Gemmatimonadaceae bacterium]
MQDSTTYVTQATMPRIAFNSNSYSIARRIGRATRAAGVMACGVALLQACSGSDAVEPISPTNSTPVGQIVGTATVGSTLDAPVRLAVTGSDGRPVGGAKVLWMASDGGKVSSAETTTDGNGVAAVRWTLGTMAGLQSLTANVAGLAPVIFGANAVADRAAVVRLSTDLVRVTLLGDTIHFSTTVADKYGNAVGVAPTLTLEGGSDALVASGGQFIAHGRGTAFIRAIADTASSRLTVLVDPATPVVTRVSPDTLVPGAQITVEGTGFALAADAVDLTVAGVKATVIRVSASRIEALVPTTYGCMATTAQPVKVTIAAASGQLATPFRTATRVALAKGESANILDVDQVRCTELVAPANSVSAKYVVAVINTSVTAAATSGFELRGAGAGALAGHAATPRSSVQMASTTSSSIVTTARMSAAMAPLASEAKTEARHDDYLDAQRAINARFGSPAPTWRALSQMRSAGVASAMASARAPMSLGDTVTMKALYGSCTAGRDIRARVVYAGAKSVVLEDIAAPRAGTMDEQYALIGDEYDRVQYPLMVDQVGDPLAMNATMGGDGRVTMLFTRYVNDSLPGSRDTCRPATSIPKARLRQAMRTTCSMRAWPTPPNLRRNGGDRCAAR